MGTDTFEEDDVGIFSLDFHMTSHLNLLLWKCTMLKDVLWHYGELQNVNYSPIRT